MTRTKITRICSGEYEIGHGEYVVSISRRDDWPSDGPRWIASANWDQFLYSDPLFYLKDAKRCAKEMIDEAIMDDLLRVTESNQLRRQRLGLAPW